MSCGRAPFFTYTRDACFPNEIEPCPAGYAEDGIEEVLPANSHIDYCFGDLIQKKLRFRRRCRKIDWSSTTEGQLLNCCTGYYDTNAPELAREFCPPNHCFNSKACDATMTEYCRKYWNTNDKSRELCGCLLPPEEYANSKLIGAPECIDKRCAQNPRAYKTEAQRQNKCQIVNCIIDVGGDIDINDSNISEDLFRQQCGNEATDKLFGKDKGGEQQAQTIITTIQNYFSGLNKGSYWSLIVFIILITLSSLVGLGWIIWKLFFK